MKTVVLLTAGTGSRMGKYADVTNKTLLPIEGKAIISHIIEQFDSTNTRFIIAVGYKQQLVIDYVSLAHRDLNVTYVHVEDFSTSTSGPAQSLLSCRPEIGEGTPFYVIACDALYEGLDSITEEMNTICASRIDPIESPAYCNLVVHPDRIEVVDKKFCTSGLAFNGGAFIKDAVTFWKNLSGTELSSGLASLDCCVQETGWVDLGTFEKYQNYLLKTTPCDFSKTAEMLYIINGKVIKWFSDESITINRLLRTKSREKLFPAISDRRNGFYAYDFVPGKVLYDCITPEIFDEFLRWLSFEFWPTHVACTDLDNHCYAFYFEKTMQRLQAFKEKHPDFNPTFINGEPMKLTMEEGLKQLDWDAICQSDLYQRSAFIHGDLQFDNVIYDGGKFTALDWRQDFAGDLEVGDLYYDIAKLKGGLILCYDAIKRGEFKFTEEEEGHYTARRFKRFEYDAYIDKLEHLLPNPVIDDIVTLIFLNMAPLHSEPLDKFLFCIALERLNDKRK